MATRQYLKDSSTLKKAATHNEEVLDDEISVMFNPQGVTQHSSFSDVDVKNHTSSRRSLYYYQNYNE